ncbi:MAG TPA: PepSY-associated TM helix domain-containing protein [Vicinamibacterales bacterium]|jgi:uncharacterized iron-regulated membrane protein|nr:PepSY-associated TM helix domain-containing protein [Vicinamibacterales bacterium]
MKLRTLLFWPHLVAGALAGALILLMSATGVLLTYERQLIEWSNSGLRSSVPDSVTRLPVEQVVASFQLAEPDLAPSSVAVGADPGDPVIVSAGQRSFYLDAYTGRLLGESRQGMRQFMSDVRAWHRWLAAEGEARTTARAFTGWSNLLFLFIVCSGLYLWFPRKWTWQRVRPVVWFTRGARGKARDFNWHNTLGVCCLVPLFIIVLSAVPMSFPWANEWVYRAAGEAPPPARRGGPGEGGGREGGRGGNTAARVSLDGLDGLLQRARQQERDWQTVSVRLPESSRGPVSFAIDRGDGGQPQLRSTLTLDRGGSVVRYETFADQGPGRRLRSLMRFAHTGEVLGLAGQTVAGLASAGAVVLVWTGIALALRRGRAWLSRRRSRASVPVAENPAA